MSYHDRRYDRNAPWKSHRSESGGRESPDRHRHSTESSPRRYTANGDRRYYGNRDWNYGPYGKRPPTIDFNRYRYVRKQQYDEYGQPKEGPNDKNPPNEREAPRSPDQRSWSNRKSPDNSPVAPWITNPEATPCDSQNLGQPNHPFNFLFQHINQDSGTGETGSRMSLIDRLIADEAMRMLSKVASSNETTTLNEPCEAVESIPAPVISDNAHETPPEVVEIIDDSSCKATTDQAAAAAAVRAADSALLQKSAEQVTKKLLNQLSTMSKYDLKQMIDNPAGKYETALNRHAQSKLRAEVRKQLKCIGLSNELGKACENGTSGMEADEAIDADKIPTALLQQIGQALDLDLLDYVPPDPKTGDPSMEQEASNGSEANEFDNTECALVEPTSTDHTDASNTKHTTVGVVSVCSIGTNKNAGIIKPSATTPTRRNRKVAQTPSTTTAIATVDLDVDPVGAHVKPKDVTPPIRRKSNIPNSPTITRKGLSPNMARDPAATTLSPLSQAKLPRKKSNVTPNMNNSVRNSESQPTAEGNLVASAELPFSTIKIAPFLRVSTVEELNKRLDDHQETNDSNKPATVSDGSEQQPPCSTASAQTDENVDANGSKQQPAPTNTLTSTSPSSNVIRIRADLQNSTPNHDNGWRQFESVVQQVVTAGDTSQPVTNNTEDAGDATLTKANRKQLLAGISDRNDRKRVLQILQRNSKRPKGKNKHTVSMPRDNEMQTDPGTSAPNGSINTATMGCQTPKKRKTPKKKNRKPTTAGANKPVNTATGSTEVVANEDLDLPTICSVPVAISDKSGLSKKSRKQSRFGPEIVPAIGFSTKSHSRAETNSAPPRAECSQNVECTLPTPTETHQEIQGNGLDQNSAHNAAAEITQQSSRTSPDATPARNTPIIRIRTMSLSKEPASSTVPANDVQTNSSLLPMTISNVQSGPEVIQPLPLSVMIYQSEQQSQETRILSSSEIATAEILPSSSSPPEESKEGIERMSSPQTALETSGGEYILGDAEEEKHIAERAVSDHTPPREVQADQGEPTTPHTTVDPAKLQPLLSLTEQMQSIDAQTMELFNRKMQIDATIMNLNVERMEIDQQLVKLQHIRGEQMNFMRVSLHGLGTGETVQPAAPMPPIVESPLTRANEVESFTTDQTVQQAPVQQHERTIRRITPISGNSELMRIFQRRRAPSERSTEENPPGGDRV